jgi:hypothetical protein
MVEEKRPSKGKHVILIDAYTKDEEKITCMKDGDYSLI